MTPTTSSSPSPTTGMRENPLRSASESACRSDFVCSMKTMSVRGTMTSRTIVSPSSKTECTIRRSSSSMTIDSSTARSTRSRSSASDANGPSRKPLPGVTALPMRIRIFGSGPRIAASGGSTAAATRPMAPTCCRPTVRGETPTMTNDATTITPAVTPTAAQRLSNSPSVTAVTSAVAISSQISRSSRAMFRYRAVSSAISRRFRPSRPSPLDRSSTVDRDSREIAASIAANAPATATSATARMISDTSEPMTLHQPCRRRCCQAASRRFCSSNICFSSAGSPWS